MYDLKSLFRFREILEGLDPNGSPQVEVSGGESGRVQGAVGILSGSFNPPTLAHMELARRSKVSFGLDRVYFTVSRVTIDKELVEGLMLEDRLSLLCQLTDPLEWAAVAVVNKGLYAEQAEAFRSILGRRAKMFFIVGMDKVFQIFDARYYEDREKSLKGLFSESGLIAAGRGALGARELGELLDKAENQPYRETVHYLSLPEKVRHMASSELRLRIGAGERAQGRLPEAAERFVASVRAYQPGYADRCRLLEHLYKIREWAEKECDLEALVGMAGEDTDRGAKLRRILDLGRMDPNGLRELVLDARQPRTAR